MRILKIDERKHYFHLPVRAHQVSYEFNPHQYCFVPHFHGEIELLHLMRGALDVEVNGERFTMTEGETVIFNRYEVHMGSVNREAGMAEYCYCLTSPAELLKSEWHNLIAELTNGTALFCRRTKNAAVGEAVDGLTALNKDKERTASADMRILSLLYGIFAELEDAGMIRHNLTANAKKSEFCGQVLEFLEMNYQNDITTELLCLEFPYSYSHFCRLFKQNFGKPFFSYLMEYRIGQAIQLYMSEQSEKLPIREIAQRVGIPDQYRFSHSFKKIVGISPSEYMRAKAARTT